MVEHPTVEVIADLEAAVKAGLEYFPGEGEAVTAAHSPIPNLRSQTIVSRNVTEHS